MRARKIKRLRLIIQEKGYYENRLNKLLPLEEELISFRRFECESFFVGSQTAEINLEKYSKKRRILYAKIRYYRKKAGV